MLFALVAAGAALGQAVRLLTPWSYRDLFVQVGQVTGIDENLLQAIAWHESNFNPAAIGAVNSNGTRDYGLMQINSSNLASLGLTTSSALDATASVHAAAALLQSIRAVPGRTLADVISIYNAGTENGAARKNVDGTYVNQAYVDDVLMKRHQIQLAAFGPIGTFG